jgi:GntR family transcriptional regulator
VSENARQWPSRRIAEQLKTRIDAGDFKPGEKLPSDRKLSETEDVARNTVQAAFRLLEDWGLINIIHGSGAYVRQPTTLIRLGGNRYSRALREETLVSPFHAELIKQGRSGHAECTSVERVRPPSAIAERLGISDKTKSVVARENWYYVENHPVQVCWTYIPAGIAQGTVLARNAELGPGDLYARLEETGHPIVAYRDEITARMPTPEEIAGLKIPAGVPVIELLHTSIDDKDQPFEVTRFVMRADVMSLDYTVANDT